MFCKERVYQHLACLGLTQYQSAKFADQVGTWVTHSGLEWTCQRLKGLKQSFKDRLETGVYSIPDGWATRKNRNGKTVLKDNFVHRALSNPDLSSSNLKKIQALLRLPTLIKLKEISETQETKMLNAITSEASVDLGNLMKRVKEQNLTRVRRISRKQIEKVCSDLVDLPVLHQMMGTSEKTSPVIESETPATFKVKASARRNTYKSANFLEYFSKDKRTNSLWCSFPEEVSHRLTGSNLGPVCMTDGLWDSDAPAGTITVIQEGGCKARWVANPLLAFQALGEPLKVKLQRYSKMYPEIGVDDQDSAREDVVRWLVDGRKVWCFDATSFTDRFPLVLQLDVLNNLKEAGLVSDFDVESLLLVVTKPWVWRAKDLSMKWSVGQPLGYGPSFPLACLTHAVLLDNLDRNRTRMWRVVGDDVVIADEELALSYKGLMDDAGVEINLSKSLISNEYAEFLGKLITPYGVIPSMKVSTLNNPDRLVSALAFYGKTGLPFLSHAERQWAKQAYLPLELGGLGWELTGITTSEFISMTKQKQWANAKLLKDLSAFSNVLELADSSAIQRQMEERTKWFDSNSFHCQAPENQERVNGFTNIPVGDSRGQAPNKSVYRHPTWMDLIDTDVSLNKGKTFSSSQYFNSNGYISNNEKPFNGQSCQYRSTLDELSSTKDTPRGKSNLVFHWQGVKNILGQEERQFTEEVKAIFGTLRKTKSTERYTHG